MSTFSVGGLATGLDTKGIISQLMQVESAPVTKVDWTRQLWQTRQSKWNDLNGRLSSLSSQASALMNPATWTVFGGITSTNSAVVGATATTTNPASGKYDVNVTQLATTDTWTAGSVLGTPTAGQVQTGVWYRNAPVGSAAQAGTLLTSLRTQTNAATGLNAGSTITMQYNEGGSTHTATFNVTATSKMSDLTAFAQSQMSGATVSLDAAGRIQVASAPGTVNEVSNLSFSAKNSAGTALAAFGGSTGAQSSRVTAASDGGAASGDTLSITQNGSTKYVNVAAGDTEAVILTKINATAGIGVTAALVAGKLRLTSNTSGAASDFTVGSTGGLAASLGFANTTPGVDAQFTLTNTSTTPAGAPVAYTRASNTGLTDVITGVTLDLKALTGGTPVSLNVGAGQVTNDSIKQKIKDFVTQYNSVVEYVNSTTGEAKVAKPKTLGDYLQGPLANDYAMGNVKFDMSRIAGDSVSGLPAGLNTLADIGISSGGFSSLPGAQNTSGKLVLDETKLDAALASNRQGVQDLLTKVGAGNTSGVIRQLSVKVSNMITYGGSVKSAMQGASDQMVALQKRMDTMNDHLATKKAYYEKMFASLETTVGRMQSQFAGLAGKLQSMSN